MKRRQVFLGAPALLGPRSGVFAQAPRPPGAIGYLHPRTIAPDHFTLAVLSATWRRLGYVEGETVLLRAADGDARRLPELVAELVALKVGVLIVVGAAAVRAASQVTRTTPIVAIDLETDPVRTGLAASFARPGGNVTGLFVDLPSLAGKWIDLLREAAPSLERLALVWDPGSGRGQLEVAQAAARAKRLESIVIELHSAADFDQGLRGLGNRPQTGLVFLTTPGFSPVYPRFAAAAQRHRLPGIAFQKSYASAGGLMAYGVVQDAYYPRAVVLADKILKGAKPGELPIEGPDRFELVINLKTAKALGLAIPQLLLLRADEVIE